jgi:fumarylpyruvate hydrolase
MTTIPIVGETDVFQVRRIYCIGRNYAAHAIERGSDPNREPPFFFQKPTDAIQNVAIGEVADHPYPSLTKNYHHEVELVAALRSGGTNIPPEKALDHCLWLRVWPRYDPARPAERHGGGEEALGDRQEL